MHRTLHQSCRFYFVCRSTLCSSLPATFLQAGGLSDTSVPLCNQKKKKKPEAILCLLSTAALLHCSGTQALQQHNDPCKILVQCDTDDKIHKGRRSKNAHICTHIIPICFLFPLGWYSNATGTKRCQLICEAWLDVASKRFRAPHAVLHNESPRNYGNCYLLPRRVFYRLILSFFFFFHFYKSLRSHCQRCPFNQVHAYQLSVWGYIQSHSEHGGVISWRLIGIAMGRQRYVWTCGQFQTVVCL